MEITINEKRVEIWLRKAIKSVMTNGLSQDVHISEISNGKTANLNQEALFDHCLLISNLLSKILIKYNINKDIEIYLSVELICIGNIFHGKPNNLMDLMSSIDINSEPEIIIYKASQSTSTNLTELYRVPILINSNRVNRDIKIFYKEYRTFESLTKNEDYRRELMLIYQHNTE
jgi:hypothetical protein